MFVKQLLFIWTHPVGFILIFLYRGTVILEVFKQVCSCLLLLIHSISVFSSIALLM